MGRVASERSVRVIQAVWIAGFLVGTTSHVLDLITGGATTYAEFPVGLRMFWMSLTGLDPATALLVLLRRRAGVALGILVIVADVTVNGTVFLTIGGNPLFGLVNQTLFAIVLLATAPTLWRGFRRTHEGRVGDGA